LSFVFVHHCYQADRVFEESFQAIREDGSTYIARAEVVLLWGDDSRRKRTKPGDLFHHELVQLELVNPVRIQLPALVADHSNLEPVPCFEFADKLDHQGMRLRLFEHELLELHPRESPLPVKHHQVQAPLFLSFFRAGMARTSGAPI
jgi:hypothetical protein